MSAVTVRRALGLLLEGVVVLVPRQKVEWRGVVGKRRTGGGKAGSEWQVDVWTASLRYRRGS